MDTEILSHIDLVVPFWDLSSQSSDCLSRKLPCFASQSRDLQHLDSWDKWYGHCMRPRGIASQVGIQNNSSANGLMIRFLSESESNSCAKISTARVFGVQVP